MAGAIALEGGRAARPRSSACSKVATSASSLCGWPRP